MDGNTIHIASLLTLGASGGQSLALALGVGSLVLLVCHHLRVPAILPLLGTGLLLGKSGAGALGLKPLIDGDTLGTEGLSALVTVAISILIFEGALHLDRRMLRTTPRATWRIITLGALVTWAGAGILATLLPIPIESCIVLGAILIVTGPTVIQPIIRRVRLTPALNSLLANEGILIDAIGAVVAVSTIDAVTSLAASQAEGGVETGASAIAEAVVLVLTKLIGGLVIGVAFGAITATLMRRTSAAERREGNTGSATLQLLAMGGCMSAVGASELFAEEAGLAAATACGLMIARTKILGLSELRKFKELIAGFFLAVLFVLLASRFEVTRMLSTDSWREVVFAILLILVVRPMNVAASTFGSALSGRERAFASLFAPRGIVAASIGSLATIRLGAAGFENSERVESAVFIAITVTVLIATLGARRLAVGLRVLAPKPNAVLIVGAHRLGRELARALMEVGVTVRLVDRNPSEVAAASSWGIPTELGDATDFRWMEEDAAPANLGWVVALTGNSGVDRVIGRWGVGRCGAGRGQALIDDAEQGAVRPALSLERSLRSFLADLDRGSIEVISTEDPPKDFVPFAAIHGKDVRLIAAGEGIPDLDDGAKYVGLIPKEPTEGT